MKQGSWNLNVTWTDSSTTVGTFAFTARDSKTLSLTGQVTGGTNPRFATGSGLIGLVAMPVDPCVGGPTVLESARNSAGKVDFVREGQGVHRVNAAE